MVTRLTGRQIRYAVAQRQEGRPAADIAAEIGVTVRHARRPYAEFVMTGAPHAPRRAGRRARDMPFSLVNPDGARYSVSGAPGPLPGTPCQVAALPAPPAVPALPAAAA